MPDVVTFLLASKAPGGVRTPRRDVICGQAVETTSDQIDGYRPRLVVR